MVKKRVRNSGCFNQCFKLLYFELNSAAEKLMLVLGVSPKLNLVTFPKASPNESSQRAPKKDEKKSMAVLRNMI